MSAAGRDEGSKPASPPVEGAAALTLALARGEDGAFFPPHQPAPPGVALALIRRHQVAPLCSWMLEHRLAASLRERLASVEPGLAEELRRDFLHHLVANEALLEDLGQITAALRARSIPHLVLKGPWLAWAAYPHPATRPMGDIDLCIPEQAYLPTVDLLRAAGYAPDRPIPATGGEALRRCHYGRQLRFAAPGRTVVELHFRLVNLGPPSISERWVWSTAREITAGTCRIPVPGSEPMLLHLLLHANQHAFAVLRLLHDIRWALERDGNTFDWDVLIARIRELRCARSAYHALLLSRELAGAPVPGAALAALRPSSLGRAAFARCWHLDAVRRLAAEQRPSMWEAPVCVLLEIGGWTSRLSYLAQLAGEALKPGGKEL